MLVTLWELHGRLVLVTNDAIDMLSRCDETVRVPGNRRQAQFGYYDKGYICRVT
jgi:hypothetical protein